MGPVTDNGREKDKKRKKRNFTLKYFGNNYKWNQPEYLPNVFHSNCWDNIKGWH